MSSNQSNTSQRRVGSIRRRLVTKIIGGKIGSCFWNDILLLFVMLFVWLTAVEIALTGSIDLASRTRYLNVHKVEADIDFANMKNIEDVNKGLESIDGILTYEIVDKATGEYLVKITYFSILIKMTVLVSGLFVIQIGMRLLGIPSARAKVKKILRPIDELANKADEIARIDFSEDKYQLIEDTISNIAPDEDVKISLGDEDLLGIENAMNSLIARIRQSNRQQARFVNDASHELRTPIAVIQGYANMLSRWGMEDEKVLEESITAIKNESDNMKHLVEQLLFLARGDAGRTAINKARINICALAREVYEESLMIDENHVYKLSCPDKDVFVFADEGLIKQSMRILVDNAAKYTHAKDEIIIKAGVKAEEGFLQVQDTGIGMKENDVEHMFERFYRADEARSYDGTGLGLSIAKWIVDKHEGHFEIVSREGIGTRIGVFLKLLEVVDTDNKESDAIIVEELKDSDVDVITADGENLESPASEIIEEAEVEVLA